MKGKRKRETEWRKREKKNGSGNKENVKET